MIEAVQTEVVKIKDGTFCEAEASGLSHVYRNTDGLRVPSVTQALAFVGLVDFSRVAPDVLRRKRMIGIAVHSACEFIDSPDKGELDWDTVDPAAVPYILAYEKFCREMEFKVEAIEEAGIGKAFGMEFGYRIDRRGVFGNGLPVIVELKCGYKEEVSWPLQLGAYELVSPKLTGKYKNYHRIAVQLKKDASFRAHGYQKPTDQKHFLSALSLTWFKLNHQFALPEVPEGFGVDEEEP